MPTTQKLGRSFSKKEKKASQNRFLEGFIDFIITFMVFQMEKVEECHPHDNCGYVECIECNECGCCYEKEQKEEVNHTFVFDHNQQPTDSSTRLFRTIQWCPQD